MKFGFMDGYIYVVKKENNKMDLFFGGVVWGIVSWCVKLLFINMGIFLLIVKNIFMYLVNLGYLLLFRWFGGLLR